MNKELPINARISFLVAFILVFFGGYHLGRSGFVVARDSNSLIPVIKQEEGKPSEIDFSLFWDAWKIVGDNYVKTPNDQERLYGSIAGMVAGLGDPYSGFMKPADNARFNDELNGNFEGIGAELTQKDGFITVVAPLDESPAQKAGIQPGDVLATIDDKDVPNSLDEAVKLIRGPKGTKVKLGIVRANAPVEVTITRDKIEDKSVSYTLKDGVGVIDIDQFSGNTVALLDESLAKAKKDNVKGIVVDLRNDPGGLLNVAVDVTSRFIEPGVVVYERDRAGALTPLNTVGVSDRVAVPIVVLVNKGSASSSEIFAGALQDAGRAKLVGETTFGKGSVQSIEPLKDGSSVRVTIAEWLTPKKREINKQGIKPDTEVGRSEDDIKNNRDPQLDKALELLK